MSGFALRGPNEREQIALVDGLLASRLFAGLGDDAIVAVARAARIKQYKPLAEAVVEGAACDEIEVVTSGRFIVLLPTDQLDVHGGAAVVGLDAFVPGDCFGQSGLADAAVATASIIAIEPATTVAISIADLKRMLDEDDRNGAIVYRNLFSIQSERLAAVSS